MRINFSLKDLDENKSDFDQIYENYKKQMLYVANRILKDSYLAEDAVQNAFIKLIPKLPQFKELTSKETRRYILLATESAAIDLYRKIKKMGTEYFDDLPHEFSVNDANLENGISLLIDKLPINYSNILKYRYRHGYSYKEIALTLSISEATVRKRVERAKIALLKEIDKEGILL